MSVKGNPNFVYWDKKPTTSNFTFGNIAQPQNQDLNTVISLLNQIEKQVTQMRVVVDWLYFNAQKERLISEQQRQQKEKGQ